MSDGISLIKDGMNERLKQMLSRAQSTKASARLYPLYQKLQVERFMSENTSEGDQWRPLTPVYAKRKLKQFKQWPGHGTKTLIASSTLAGAVIGPGAPFEGTDKHSAVFSPYKMQIQVISGGVNAAGKRFNYAGYVDAVRPFMKFSDKSIQIMKTALKQYMVGK